MQDMSTGLRVAEIRDKVQVGEE